MKSTRLSGWVRGLIALCAVMLLAAPALASTARPLGDCCAGEPCHEMGKATCPSICVMACQAVVAPGVTVIEAPEFGLIGALSVNWIFPLGRTPSPETPPPRPIRA